MPSLYKNCLVNCVKNELIVTTVDKEKANSEDILANTGNLSCFCETSSKKSQYFESRIVSLNRVTQKSWVLYIFCNCMKLTANVKLVHDLLSEIIK